VAKPSLPHAVVRLYPKRGENDCGVAVLASYLRCDYEEVLLAAAKVNPHVWQRGLYYQDFVKVASRLGVPAKWTKAFSTDDDCGVLWVTYNDLKMEHVVLLDEGRIYDSDHNPVSVWSTEDFFAHYNAVPVHLLVKQKED